MPASTLQLIPLAHNDGLPSAQAGLPVQSGWSALCSSPSSSLQRPRSSSSSACTASNCFSAVCHHSCRAEQHNHLTPRSRCVQQIFSHKHGRDAMLCSKVVHLGQDAAIVTFNMLSGRCSFTQFHSCSMQPMSRVSQLLGSRGVRQVVCCLLLCPTGARQFTAISGHCRAAGSIWELPCSVTANLALLSAEGPWILDRMGISHPHLSPCRHIALGSF